MELEGDRKGGILIIIRVGADLCYFDADLGVKVS